jgi:hypothetical protein
LSGSVSYSRDAASIRKLENSRSYLPFPPSIAHRTLTLPALALLLATAAQAQTEYYRHSVFDNSLQRDFYYYSFAQATAPSSLEGRAGGCPSTSSTPSRGSRAFC